MNNCVITDNDNAGDNAVIRMIDSDTGGKIGGHMALGQYRPRAR